MKPNRSILIVVVVVLIICAAVAYVYYLGRSGQRMVADNTSQPLIGGDKDAHGCLIAAGYSWCDAQQKCLRLWEESCYPEVEKEFTAIFVQKYNKPEAEVNITILQKSENYVRGSILIGDSAEGAGGEFLARLVDGAWTIDYEGNGSIDCPKIRALGYPQTVLEGFCDPIIACTEEAKICPDGSSVGRSGPNCEFAPCPGGAEQPATSTLSEAQARVIAEKTCIKGGESLAPGVYNEITKTWWFDANLNAAKDGCNPACVVDEATQTAEINWRCTGLIEPK